MHVSVTWHDGQYPSFNVDIASKEGRDAFLSIKGCKLANGQNGPFVSYPSRKTEAGKYWNHVWGSNDFNAVVLEKALATQPSGSAAGARKPNGKTNVSDDDSIPF